MFDFFSRNLSWKSKSPPCVLSLIRKPLANFVTCKLKFSPKTARNVDLCVSNRSPRSKGNSLVRKITQLPRMCCSKVKPRIRIGIWRQNRWMLKKLSLKITSDEELGLLKRMLRLYLENKINQINFKNFSCKLPLFNWVDWKRNPALKKWKLNLVFYF